MGELGLELTWENYIQAMESAPLHVPMGGELSFADGERTGITALALNTVATQINPDTGMYDLLSVSPILALDDVMAAAG